MYTSLIYNVYVATSITTQGRELTSSATMFFESFLADNVKFGSLNEVVEFINNVQSEYYDWTFNDLEWLDNFFTIDPEDVFAKLVMDCGYRWIPNTEEMEIIWDIVNKLDRRTLVRVWYKNNLYEFMENNKVFDIVRRILHNLNKPIMFAGDIPIEAQDDIKLLASLLKEFVYYRYMIIDRIDRTNHMIKSVICVTDTDSCILSLDAWFRYVSQKIAGEDFRIMNSLGSPIDFYDWTEEDEISGKPKPWEQAIEFVPVKYDYDFNTDELVEMKHIEDPVKNIGEDNMRISIINIMAYCIDLLINDYMTKVCYNNNSIGNKWDRPCRINMKNEFF